jgi:hypothetical protein
MLLDVDQRLKSLFELQITPPTLQAVSSSLLNQPVNR